MRDALRDVQDENARLIDREGHETIVKNVFYNRGALAEVTVTDILYVNLIRGTQLLWQARSRARQGRLRRLTAFGAKFADTQSLSFTKISLIVQRNSIAPMKALDAPCIFEALFIIQQHQTGEFNTNRLKEDWELFVMFNLHIADPKLKEATMDGDLEKSMKRFFELYSIPIGFFNRHCFVEERKRIVDFAKRQQQAKLFGENAAEEEVEEVK